MSWASSKRCALTCCAPSSVRTRPLARRAVRHRREALGDNRTFEIPIPIEASVPLHPLVPLQLPHDATQTPQSELAQDLYSPPTPVIGVKLDPVCTLLENAVSDSSSDHFYVNYLSASPLLTAHHWSVLVSSTTFIYNFHLLRNLLLLWILIICRCVLF